MAEKRCPGCGAILQTIDDSLEGYIPPMLYKRKGAVCQRCFKLQNYGQLVDNSQTNHDYLELLRRANENHNLLVYVIDIFNFAGSIIDNLKDYVPNCPIFVVANKYDLLPKSLKEEKIKNWLSYQLKKTGINYVDMVLVSSKNNRNIDGLLTRIKSYANKHDIYVIGNANVGKSSLVNSLLRNYENDTTLNITSSIFPGTTINTIKIPLDKKTFLLDTPGFDKPTCIYRYLDGKNLKRVLNSKEIKPLNLTLNSGQAIFIGSLAYLEFSEGSTTPFIIYGSNLLHIHRTKKENIAEKFAEIQKDPLYVPKANCYLDASNMDCFEFNLTDHKRISVVISGLAFIDILKGNQKIKVYVPKGIAVELYEPMVGGSYHADE